jgi:hypothetical protein
MVFGVTRKSLVLKRWQPLDLPECARHGLPSAAARAAFLWLVEEHFLVGRSNHGFHG